MRWGGWIVRSGKVRVDFQAKIEYGGGGGGRGRSGWRAGKEGSREGK